MSTQAIVQARPVPADKSIGSPALDSPRSRIINKPCNVKYANGMPYPAPTGTLMAIS